MTFLTRLGLFGCVATLTACSSVENRQNVFTVGKAVIGQLSANKPAEPDPNEVARVAQHALTHSTGPLAIYRLEERKAVAIIRPIARNGAYRTWASYGSSERRSVSSRNGVLTATRGLGNDLMSSDIDSLLALVSHRQAGTASIEQRYLDGENQTVTIRSDCTVSRGESEAFTDGTGRTVRVTRMMAQCDQDERRVTNSYLVTDAGEIVQSRHWAGPTMGHSVVQRLR